MAVWNTSTQPSLPLSITQGPNCIMVWKLSRPYPPSSLFLLMQVHWTPSWNLLLRELRLIEVYLSCTLLGGKQATTKVKRKKKIRMSKSWDINGRSNQSSVNMKLCNRPKKSNWSGCLVWRWLLKVTFPSLSSWNLSKSNKENLKQKCKLHFRRNLETTKTPVMW